MGLHSQDHVLQTGEARDDAGQLKRTPDASASAPARRCRSKRAAFEEDFAFARQDLAAQYVEYGGFACPVRADEHVNIVLTHVQVYIVNGFEGAVGLGQATRRKHYPGVRAIGHLAAAASAVVRAPSSCAGLSRTIERTSRSVKPLSRSFSAKMPSPSSGYGAVVWPRPGARTVLSGPTWRMLAYTCSQLILPVLGVVKQRSKYTPMRASSCCCSMLSRVVGNSGCVMTMRLTPASWAALTTGNTSEGRICLAARPSSILPLISQPT